MPQHKSCEKRMRTSAKARLRNRADRSRINTAERRVLEAKDKATGQVKLREAYDILDRLADKGVIHSNTASRQKSRLARHVNGLTA